MPDLNLKKIQTRDFGRYTLEIHRKSIQHIYFRIHPSKELIVVSAPFSVKEATLNKAILSKTGWIENQIKLAGAKPSAPVNLFVTGEKIHFQGRSCPFEVIYQQGRPTIVMPHENLIVLKIKPGSDDDLRQKKLLYWFRSQLKKNIQDMVAKWQPVLNVEVREFRVRKMKTRWGSCNIRIRRICLNSALVHLSPVFLEYVVVHEMVHLLERKHNQRFKGYMDQFIPDWRQLKKELNMFNL
ncbi:MAG: SprT family zinc-dependent metalloprotease [Pseudomonadota bacterium]